MFNRICVNGIKLSWIFSKLKAYAIFGLYNQWTPYAGYKIYISRGTLSYCNIDARIEVPKYKKEKNAKVNIGLGPVLDVTAASPSLDFF